MRDRLIEIFKKTDYNIFPNSTVNANLANQFSDYALNDIVDKLLKNGVIVPPCKVGDVVYFAVDDYHDSAVIDGIHITEQGVLFTWVQYEVGYELTECWDEGEFNIEDIGKTVFLTREEAEQALKGGGE